jgi:phospholipase/carboxylesterase
MTDSSPLNYVERPPKSSSSGPAPAIVLLHGRGADERDLLPITEALPESLHIFSVRAPEQLEDGYRWYEMDLDGGDIHSSQPDRESFDASLAKLVSFLKYAAARYETDPKRTGLLGFSQGGALALAATVRTPQRVDWTVVLNGYLPKQYANAGKLAAIDATPIFLAAGRMDLVIPKKRVKRAAVRLKDAGLDVSFDTYPTGHSATDPQIADVGDWVQKQVASDS